MLFFSFIGLLVTTFSFACECEHVYEYEIMATVDAEYDENEDDYLYDSNICRQREDDPKKLLKLASYAFDKLRYRKCLQYIKRYEDVVSPPPYAPSKEQKIIIETYRAYCKKYLKSYDSAIDHFENIIYLINDRSDDSFELKDECKFITYFEHAQCFLLKGEKNEYRRRIKKIIEMRVAPSYSYYVKNDFRINHQPCFHNHPISKTESFYFHELAPRLLGEELYATMVKNQQTPKFYTVADLDEDKEFCRRLCGRASILSAIIVGCITKKAEAIAATMALGEILLDCDNCCNEGFGSKNCLKDIKTVFWQVCQENLLEGL